MSARRSGSRLLALFRGRWVRCRNARKLHQWVRDGMTVPPPHVVKQMAVREHADRFSIRTFVETGTYEGEMVDAVRKDFDAIFSIELDATLYEKARRRFAGDSHVTLVQGDSGVVLKELLTRLDEPVLFWLDGHFSGGITAKGESETPIMKELESIYSHRLARRHVILIDDARLFDGRGDYPGIAALEGSARVAGYDRFEVRDDMIRIFSSR